MTQKEILDRVQMLIANALENELGINVIYDGDDNHSFVDLLIDKTAVNVQIRVKQVVTK